MLRRCRSLKCGALEHGTEEALKHGPQKRKNPPKQVHSSVTSEWHLLRGVGTAIRQAKQRLSGGACACPRERSDWTCRVVSMCHSGSKFEGSMFTPIELVGESAQGGHFRAAARVAIDNLYGICVH